jgi:hypothetical protein
MVIPVVCSQCGWDLRPPSTLAGRRVKGPHRQSPFDVPLEAPADEVEEGLASAGAAGAQGWSLSLGGVGVSVSSVTVAGTVAAEVSDDPPGFRDGGFEHSEVHSGGIDDCEGLHGVVSAVVLSCVQPVTLPPLGDAVVARITVEGEGPSEVGMSAPASLLFVDGCGGSG